MHTCVRIDSLPESVRADALRLGRQLGVRVEIETIMLARILKNAPADKINGLGDLVAFVAQPVARAIDKLAGTKLVGCGGCKKRRELLNQAFPLKRRKSYPQK